MLDGASREDVSVGIKEIDDQHFNLLRIINAIEELQKRGKLGKSANKTTYTLLTFTKFHFRTEEDLMTKHGYPGYKSQKTQHDRLIEKITGLHEKAESGRNVDYYDIHNFLNDWLRRHTTKYDEKYVPFFVKKGIATEIKKPAKTMTGDKKALTLGKLFLIDWLPEYDLGVDDIDRQHRNLVYAINLLYSTIGKPGKKGAVAEAFKELNKFTSQHFNREEGLMEKYGYPNLIIHRIEHDNFKEQVRQARKKFDKLKTIVDHDLVIMLRDWFFNHSQIEDRKYLGYINTTDGQR